MKKRELRRPGRALRAFWRLSMPMILLSALALLFSYLDARAVSPMRALDYYAPMMEYIFASLALVSVGTYLIDRVEREGEL